MYDSSTEEPVKFWLIMDGDRIGISRYPCRYPKCKNKYYMPIYKEDYYNKRFHRFPRNGAVSLLWKNVCNLDPGVLTVNYFVCEDHFAAEDFTNHTRQRLKAGVVPTRPSRLFNIGDRDHQDESGVQVEAGTVPVPEYTNSLHRKYAFLFDKNVGLLDQSSSSIVESDSEKLTMLNVHQVITLNLLRLKNVLHNEKHLLQKLVWLYDDGKFKNINRELDYVSNEFLQYQLGHVSPLNVKNWTEEEHFMALSFYNKNEKLYKYLCSFFHLPPVKKLKQILYNIPFKTGINKQLLGQMKLDVRKMNVGSQTCVLLMDELMLTSGVNYNETNQCMCGYEDLGHYGRSAKPADRVLVFTARGLRKNWTQVVSYYFSCGPFKDITMQNIIVILIKYLQALDLNVTALVCEQNSTNLNALALLTARTERRRNSSYFLVNCKRICIIFDVRYLLKETRNALTKCKILYDQEAGKTAKLEHIESAYNLDMSKRIFKQLYKLKDQYFREVNTSDKSDITAATAIFSHTVAIGIETFVTCGDLPQEAMNTAEFVETMDTLFDSLSSSERKPLHYKRYRCALSLNSPHLHFWSTLLARFHRWKLIDLNSEQDVTSEYSFVKGWQTTIESIFYLWSHLKHIGYLNYLPLDRFNLEPLEKLFRGISLYRGDDKSPTCHQFVAALKSEILNDNGNPWTTDNCYNLTSLRAFIENIFSDDSNGWESMKEIYFDDLRFDVMSNLGFHEEAAYLSGYLLQKLEIPDCTICRSHLLAEWVVSNGEAASHKKYGDDSTYSLYASDTVVRLADRILYLLYQFLKDHSNQGSLEDNFKALYEQEFKSFRFCTVHNCSGDFISLCVKLGIYRFTHSFNKAIGLNK